MANRPLGPEHFRVTFSFTTPRRFDRHTGRKSMRIGRKLAWFAAETGRGLSPPLYKFLRDMLAGMVAKKSILLSDVGRASNEGTDLLYTEKRLSRNLAHAKMNDAPQSARTTCEQCERTQRTPSSPSTCQDVSWNRGRSFFKAIADRLAAAITRRKPKIHVHPNCGERGLVYRPAEARPNLCKS